ncbi:MAG: hypothetical protein ABII64_06830 [Elusimicrobiota bacterium]
MKQGYTNKVNITIILAFLMWPVILAAMSLFPVILEEIWLLGVLLLVALIIFIAGCCFYAQGKGYHPAFGLLGLMYIFGFVILALLPDKHKGEDTKSGWISAVLFVLLALILVLGPILYFEAKAVKHRASRTAVQQQR